MSGMGRYQDGTLTTGHGRIWQRQPEARGSFWSSVDTFLSLLKEANVMSIVAVDINELWMKKIERFSTKIRQIVRGDDDLYQEGVLGLREGLLRNPYGTDSYFITAIKWAISHYRNRGVSVDNGAKWEYKKRLVDGTVKRYRKDMHAVYIDKLVSEFELSFPDYSYAPDILALDKICAEKFYKLLNKSEAEFVDACIETMGRYFYNSEARRELGIGRVKYNRLRRSIYEKFLRTFGTDEDIEILDEQLAGGDHYQ